MHVASTMQGSRPDKGIHPTAARGAAAARSEAGRTCPPCISASRPHRTRVVDERGHRGSPRPRTGFSGIAGCSGLGDRSELVPTLEATLRRMSGVRGLPESRDSPMNSRPSNRALQPTSGAGEGRASLKGFLAPLAAERRPLGGVDRS